MSQRYGLDVPTGEVNWHALTETVNSIARTRHIPGELASQWKERLKSEATYVVLNTLTALHTLSLNGGRPIRDQIALSKCMKHLDRLLNKPPFPGVENAAAQLLMDWAFLYGGEDVGMKSFTILTSTSKHRAMLQGMQASDVAVMLREDQKIGMPQFVRVVRGLDFGRHFAASQFGSPLTGAAAPQGVLSFLAKAAVAASYSGSSTAAAAAASRNTFAAWAERVQQDPQGAAYKVLSAEQYVQADTQALAAAQAACLAAARPFLSKPQQQRGSSSSGSKGKSDPYADLRRELDRAYLVACKCTEWREMIQVLLQNPLPDSQISALLRLADSVNATLEEWQAAATTEIFWLLGVDTAGLADGSILKKVLIEASLAPAAAAAGSSAAAPQQQQQQQQQQVNATARASYLDLLTGDSLPLSSSDRTISNPFITDRLALENAASSQSNNPFLATSSSSNALAAAAAAAGTASAALPPQLQSYIQETTGGPSPPAATAAAPAAAAAAAVYPAIAARPFPAVVGGSTTAASDLTGSSSSSKYPEVPAPAVHQPVFPLPIQQQQPGQLIGSSSSVTDLTMGTARLQQQQQQQQQQSAVHSFDSGSWANALDQVSLHKATTISSSSSSMFGSGSYPIPTVNNSTQAAAGAIPTPAAAAAAAGSSGGTAAAAAASGSGSSTDSPTGSYNYINPFAALDTNKIITGLKLTSPRSSSDGAALGTAAAAAGANNAAAAAAAAAAAKQPIRSSSVGTAVAGSTILSTHQQQQKWQQQQQVGWLKKREPPLPPPGCQPATVAAAMSAGATGAAAAAAAAETAMSRLSGSSSTHDLQQQQQVLVTNGKGSPVPSPAAAAAPPLSPTSRQRVLQLQQQQQQPYLSLQEIEQLQCQLHDVFHSCSNTNSSSSSCCCQHCNMPPAVSLHSRLLQLLVQQEQQRRQQQQQQEQQHRQEMKRVKEMALEKLRGLQQQLVQAQQQLAELQQQQQ